MTRNLLTLALFALSVAGCQQQPRAAATAPKAAPALRAGAVVATPYWPTIRGLPVYDIRAKGAVPGSQATNNITAINAAINAANAAGGGMAFVPPGTWYVAPSGTTTYITAKNNVTLHLEPGAVLKVKDANGHYKSLIASATMGSTAVSNFAVEGGTIDQNPSGNTSATTTTDGQQQFGALFFNATGVRFNNVRFAPCTGVNTVVVNGTTCADVKVTNCYFNFVPKTAPASYDNSTVYVEADNYTLAGNTFDTASGSGARGAMELHDAGGICFGNTSNWYQTLANVVSTTGGTQPNYNGHTVTGNTANNCNFGVQLWPITGATLRGVTISGNTINLAQATHAQSTCMGIGVVWDLTVTGNVEGLTIAGNSITFQDEGAGRAVALEYLNNGIRLTPYGGTSSGVTCIGNTIVRAPGSAIRPSGLVAGSLLTNFNISNNTIVDAGQNVGITNGAFRAGMFLDGANIGRGVIEGNKFFDTGTSALKGVNLAWIGSAPTAVAWRNNPQYTASNNRLPLVGFNVAGLTVGANGVIDAKTDFGAKGDGVANDAGAIQDAVTVGQFNRGTVVIPPGTFLIGSTITNTAPVTIRGAGAGDETGANKAATIIQKSADVLGFKVMGSYTRLEGFCLYANLVGDTTDGIWVGDADTTNGSGESVIRDVSVIGMGGKGIWAKNGNSGRLDNVRVVGAGGAGVDLNSAWTGGAGSNVNEWTLTGVRALSCGGDGIAVTKSVRNSIIGSRGESNTGYGLSINSQYNFLVHYSENNTAGAINVGASGFSNRIWLYKLPGTTGVNTMTIANNGNQLDVQDGSGTELSQLTTGVRWFNAAVVRKRVTLTYSGFVSPAMASGNTFDLTPTNGTAFTMGNPSGGTDGDEITFTIFNTTGGALGALTWSANYHLVGGAWTQPATGNNRSISFRRSGTVYYETSRSSGDVLN